MPWLYWRISSGSSSGLWKRYLSVYAIEDSAHRFSRPTLSAASKQM